MFRTTFSAGVSSLSLSAYSMRVGNGEALALNFLSGPLDTRITFTRSTTATRVNVSGLIESVAINGPRFDYDPATLQPKGILIEEQRTNIQTYSDDFTNAIWTNSTSLTITSNTAVSPDGLTTADTGTRSTTGAAENMRRAVTTQAINTAITFSVYVKANTAGARLYLRNIAVDATTVSGVVQFNPADGTISTTYGSTYVGKATMTAAGNGWYRCSITGTTPAVIANNFIDIGATNGTSAVGGVTGNSIFIWGAQLEAGSFATSYIPTVASQVTRSADVATMTGTNFSSWYNQSEGTFVINADSFAEQSGINAYNIVSSNDGTASNFLRAYIYATAVGMSNSVGGVVTVDISTTPWSQNTSFRTAASYRVNDFQSALNGSLTAADTSGAIPVVTRLNVGSNNGAGAPLNGHIRSIAYYNTRLSNAQLQALTA